MNFDFLQKAEKLFKEMGLSITEVSIFVWSCLKIFDLEGHNLDAGNLFLF